MKPKKPIPRQFELSKLTNSSVSNIKDKTLSEGFAPLKNVTEHIDTRSGWTLGSPNDAAEKLAQHRANSAMKKLGKKALSVLPFAGVGYAALQGNPAMAAEEAMGDVPVLGQAYEAFKPEIAGNREEERNMLNEHDARVNYDNSPAHLARLKALQGFGQ